MQYQGKPVKASRLFAGYEHEQQVKRIAAHFNSNIVKYRNMAFDADIVAGFKRSQPQNISFEKRELGSFNDSEAYHQLMLDLIDEQIGHLQNWC
jgi:hypothetical protein